MLICLENKRLKGFFKVAMFLVMAYLSVWLAVYMHVRGDLVGDDGPLFFVLLLLSGLGVLGSLLVYGVSSYLKFCCFRSCFLRRLSFLFASLVVVFCMCSAFVWGVVLFEGFSWFLLPVISYMALAVFILVQMINIPFSD